MRGLLLKLVLLGGIVLIFLSFLVWRFETGYADYFYTNFTSPKAPSLIIGTSRAAQGLKPNTIEQILGSNRIDVPLIQNFTFTVTHSPFGRAYLDLIKRKIGTTATEGIYIVAVDPWAISTLSEDETTLDTFRESKSFVSNIKRIHADPNLEYIFSHYNQPYYWAVLSSVQKKSLLHENGWLEINVPSDSATVSRKTKSKVCDYTAMAKQGVLSTERILALKATICFLDKHGQVYLTRIPTSVPMAALELAYMPQFDELMQQISDTYEVPYLNYIHASNQYKTIDGNHLHKSSSQKLSERLAQDIVALEQ